ncbi:MAG: hypothetical protein AAB092_02840 [Chloroflexota bacterium]
MPMTIRRALAWRQRKTADAGIRADTSVGATPAPGKTERYRMPIVKLPNAEAFIHAVLSTGIDSPRAVIRDVLAPTYAGMGFESRAAVKRAARESWDLPDGAVIQVGDEPFPGLAEGAVPYRMNPDGSLVPIAGEIANGINADGDR